MHKTALLLPILALALAFPGAVLAAEDDPAPGREPVPAEAEEPQPAPPINVEPVRGIRYRVWLKSGRSMEGIVRAKGVFEVHESDTGYRPADDDEAGAGVRFWFPKAQDGFIFMPVSAMERLEELGELSTDDGRSIARARVDAAQRAQRERFHIKTLRAADEDAEAEAAAAQAEQGAEEALEEEIVTEEVAAGEMAALLLRFPPDRWTLDRPKEIERRKVILGLFPSDEEKDFLAVFDQWKIAYEAWAEVSKADGSEVVDKQKKRSKTKTRKARTGADKARADDDR